MILHNPLRDSSLFCSLHTVSHNYSALINMKYQHIAQCMSNRFRKVTFQKILNDCSTLSARSNLVITLQKQTDNASNFHITETHKPLTITTGH